MKPLLEKVALVTGASAPRGIGRAISQRLAEQGAAVVVTDVKGLFQTGGSQLDRSDLLNSLVDDITREGGKALALNLDVTTQSDISRVVKEVVDAFGRIDILVNNAGSLAGSDRFLTTTAEQWELSFRVNILGPMMLSQAVIPEMKKLGGGRIINIGSTGSLGAEPGFGAYTAMKHGLVGMTKTLAAEFGVDGILCNTVCPGFIETDMHSMANHRLAGEKGISINAIKEQRYSNVAVRKAGLPEDVANAVAYLAGPQSDYVTGINLPVSGGVPFGI